MKFDNEAKIFKILDAVISPKVFESENYEDIYLTRLIVITGLFGSIFSLSLYFINFHYPVAFKNIFLYLFLMASISGMTATRYFFKPIYIARFTTFSLTIALLFFALSHKVPFTGTFLWYGLNIALAVFL